MATGMLAVVAAESLYFYTIAGDPFHHVRLVYNTYGRRSGVGPMDGTGNITDHPVVGPDLALLINNEFACCISWPLLLQRLRALGVTFAVKDSD